MRQRGGRQQERCEEGSKGWEKRLGRKTPGSQGAPHEARNGAETLKPNHTCAERVRRRARKRLQRRAQRHGSGHQRHAEPEARAEASETLIQYQNPQAKRRPTIVFGAKNPQTKNRFLLSCLAPANPPMLCEERITSRPGARSIPSLVRTTRRRARRRLAVPCRRTAAAVPLVCRV